MQLEIGSSSSRGTWYCMPLPAERIFLSSEEIMSHRPHTAVTCVPYCSCVTTVCLTLPRYNSQLNSFEPSCTTLDH